MIQLHSINAEQTLLGGLLLDPARLDDVLEVTGPSDFYDPSHALIFRCIESLAQSRSMIDITTVADVLERRGDLETIGGLAYIVDLAQNAQSGAAAVRYAKIVAERALRRRLIVAAEQLSFGAAEVEDVDELIESTLKAIEQAQPECGDEDLSTGSDLCRDALAFVTDRFENKGTIGGVSTGFVDVDKRLHGLKPGDLVIVAGRPGMGKTVYALNVAEHVGDFIGPVLFVSLEMSRLQLGLRQQANFGSINLNSLQEGDLDDEDFNVNLPNAVRRATESRLFCDFRSGLSVAQIRAKAKAVQRKHGLKMIVVDYLQKMSAKAENRTNEIRLITSGLKNIAKDLQVPVIALSQLSRKVEERADKRPMMSDLRESGDIEQEADIIQFLYRDEYYNSDSPMRGYVEIITSKQRMGEPGTDTLVFQGQYSRMSNANMADVARAKSISYTAKKASKRGFEE